MIAAKDYSTVSEAPGIAVTQENASMLQTRYALARRLSEGKDVVEVACGAGMGLGLVAAAAKTMAAGDIDPEFVAAAKARYGGRVQVMEIDAERLPFGDASRDVVLLLEAIYFIPNAKAFVKEARRVLRPGGVLLIVSANREWAAFNPCAQSTRYWSAAELKAMLEPEGFQVELFKAFADQPAGLKSKVLGFARKAAVALHLIPNTMKGKEWMKRLAFGKLVPLPREIGPDFAAEEPLAPDAGVDPVTGHKVIYCIGRLGS